MSDQTSTISERLANLPLTGCKFVGIRGYENKSTGEVSNYLFNVGISYENAKKADIGVLESHEITSDDIDYVVLRAKPKAKSGDESISREEAKELLVKAQGELIASLKGVNTKTANHRKAQEDAYEEVQRGIKKHVESGVHSLYGLLVEKTVVSEPSVTKKKSVPRNLTIAKNRLKKGLKHTKFRQFNLPDIEEIRVQGDTLVFE